MKKPEQTKRLAENPDNEDLLNELESAMESIADAMECLKGYAAFADWFDTLDDIFDEMQPEYEQYESIAADEYAKEIAGLTRDYYRSVI